jgi:hypothetical protein
MNIFEKITLFEMLVNVCNSSKLLKNNTIQPLQTLIN